MSAVTDEQLNDEQILADRALYHRVIASPELGALRCALEASKRMLDDRKRSAELLAKRRPADSQGASRAQLNELEERARTAAKRVQTVELEVARLTREYDRARVGMLAAHGVDDAAVIRQTSEEARRRAEHERDQVEFPPIDWGRSIADRVERLAKWRALTREERIRVPGARDTDELAGETRAGRRAIEICAGVAQEVAHRWDRSAMNAEDQGDGADYARARAQTARTIETEIRAMLEARP